MYAKQFEIKRYDNSWDNTHCRLTPSLLAFSCWKNLCLFTTIVLIPFLPF